MGQIKLQSQNIHKHTLINNLFIDSYMPSANGDYVKVYIYILRLVTSNQLSFTTKELAKQLQLIESDVIRALKYWDELRIIEITTQEDEITGIGLLSLERPEDTIDLTETKPNKASKKNQENHTQSTNTARLYKKPEYSMEEMAMMADQNDFKQLLYITEKYLGKQLTQTDVNTLLGFIDWLGLPYEVVEFLIEHCASGGHRHMNYIEKIAIDWSDKQIRTVEKAKAHTEQYNSTYYRILKALGISDRQPTASQIKMMDTWVNDFNMAIEVIEQACDKTIAAINKPSLPYVNSILEKWVKEGVRSPEDILKLDEAYKEKQSQENHKVGQNKQPTKPNTNRFINYEQRSYDHSLLEERMNSMIETEALEKRS